MSDGDKVRNWAYLLLRGQETIAEREGVKGKLRGAGDTLAELVNKYRRTVKDISHQNKISDANKIEVGQKLKL